MEQPVFKQDILDKIKDDGTLCGMIADTIGVSIFSLPRLLRKNHSKLYHINVLGLISKRLNIEQSELIVEPAEEPAAA